MPLTMPLAWPLEAAVSTILPPPAVTDTSPAAVYMEMPAPASVPTVPGAVVMASPPLSLRVALAPLRDTTPGLEMSTAVPPLTLTPTPPAMEMAASLPSASCAAACRDRSALEVRVRSCELSAARLEVPARERKGAAAAMRVGERTCTCSVLERSVRGPFCAHAAIGSAPHAIFSASTLTSPPPCALSRPVAPVA